MQFEDSEKELKVTVKVPGGVFDSSELYKCAPRLTRIRLLEAKTLCWLYMLSSSELVKEERGISNCLSLRHLVQYGKVLATSVHRASCNKLQVGHMFLHDASFKHNIGIHAHTMFEIHSPYTIESWCPK